MELLFDPEEKIQCPYDPAHYIMRKRMNTHLTKCKKNFPVSKLVECDFNVNHKVPEPELQYHHENCSDKRKVEHTVYQEEGAAINKFPVHNVAVEVEESWDYFNAPTYDPMKYCESTEVLRHLDVASAATRKNFRMEERSRINQITNNRPTSQLSQAEALPLNRNLTAVRRNLPERPSSTVTENTPESVADLMERINIGKNTAFVPKQKSDN